jgi:hypothetical protein
MSRPTTLSEIAAALRELYPDAVSVEVFVNATEHSVTPVYKDVSGPEHGATYRVLNGKWAHEVRLAALKEQRQHERERCATVAKFQTTNTSDETALKDRIEHAIRNPSD